MGTYKAVDVMYAIHKVYMEVSEGNTSYAESKTNNFLRRCGADINKPKEQPLDARRVAEVAHAALDAECEVRLYQLLGEAKKPEHPVEVGVCVGCAHEKDASTEVCTGCRMFHRFMEGQK